MKILTRLLIAAGLAVCAGTASAMTIKIATNVADTSNWVKGAEKFKEVVERESGGRHTVEIYPNGVLSGRNDRVELEMAQSGAVEIIMKSTPWLAQLHGDFMVISMPWIFPDARVAMGVMDGPVGERLNAHLESRGLHALAWGSGSFFQLYSNQGPIRMPENIAGQKIRTPGLGLYLDSWTAIGANPVAMNFAEVFSALQAGAIDGGISPIPLIYSSRFYEVSKHIALLNFSFEAIGFIASETFWSRLDDDDKELIRSAASEAMQHQRAVADAEEADLIARMEADGVAVQVLDEAEIGEFKGRVSSVFDKYKTEIGAELVEQVQDEVERLSAQ